MDWSTLSTTEGLSVPDRLSIDLERLILDGSLAAGERLPAERELAELLAVSRVSVRQALRELESRGLISRKPGRGTVVLAPGESPTGEATLIAGVLAHAARADDPISQIMELRAILEPPIAGMTARRATSRDIGQLRELLRDMDRAPSSAAYAELDRAFHQAIAQYTHNPMLALLNEQIAATISPSRHDSVLSEERRDASTAAHRRIYEAIRDGDASRAEHEAREHVRSVHLAIERNRADADGRGRAAGPNRPAARETSAQ
ncbi:FadR/GntR family transcriptional regulator [Leucobacter sp. M11]|uniref:FadR/GntR family transcriptional regulator n=1 Tax=Leucobacter sp. M11 TaxID=2993565 RepID=UPI002D7F1D9D|nr:FadR/GntR family transcriptional regulator [Leucobacter sp. M11]MEB4614755.1 FadR/GntR family transcriptional regulator [Leucobacter sp. M11]